MIKRLAKPFLFLGLVAGLLLSSTQLKANPPCYMVSGQCVDNYLCASHQGACQYENPCGPSNPCWGCWCIPIEQPAP